MNLLEIFKDMPEYVLMKMRDDFPDYKKGQDMDIVCRDIWEVIEHLSTKGLLKLNYFIDMAYRDESHYHFDIMRLDGLELRFDLYSEFISPKFTQELLNHKETAQFSGGSVCVPMPAYEGVIKCYEYLHNNKEKYSDYVIFERTLNDYLVES